MGITKTDLFSQEQNAIANFAKAFGHPARVGILQHILKSKECINSDLVTELGLAQSTISQHLRELKNLGIIQGTVDGASMNYCINSDKWAEIKDLFNQLFDQHSSCNGKNC